MKLNSMKGILRSSIGEIQTCVVWDSTNLEDIANGCSVEYAIKTYGDRPLDRIYITHDGELVISIK